MAAAWLRPRSASLPRSVAEGFAGHVVLVTLGAAVNGFGSGPGPVPAGLLAAFGWIWLAVWPAWRLRPAQGESFRSRLGRAASRNLLAVLLVGLFAVFFTEAAAIVFPRAWPWHGFGPNKSHAAAVPVFFGYFVARGFSALGAWIAGKMGQRLRWQLLVTHVAVVVIALTVLAGAGSIGAAHLLLWGTRPDAAAMAGSLSDLVTVGGASTLDPARSKAMLEAVTQRKVVLAGEEPFSRLFSTEVIPANMQVMRPDGRVVAAASNRDRAPSWRRSRTAAPVWKRLRKEALAGRSFAMAMPPGSGADFAGTQVAEAPVRGPSGRLLGVAVIQVPRFDPGSVQIFGYTVAIFLLATALLITAGAVPLLALSLLFSLLVARSLTRGLESVSRVAGSIASGDLSRRAPVTQRNEIGGLALDINHMAERLERLVTELREARSQAEESLRARQELVANVSHELRTPLAIVRAQLDSLALHQTVASGGSPRDEVTVPAGTLDALRGETERLEALIEDLFALSRAQGGSLQVDISPVDVAVVVDDVAAVMAPLAWSEGAITLSVDVPPGLPPAVADSARLHQILSNLIRNAIRHTPDGGIIALAASHQESRIVLSVADTGEGIPPEHVPHVFERFFRADDSRTRRTSGTGLGLAIVRELVELMGGEVSVESTLGEGSCFRVALRAWQPPQP
jgi:signal transduction histidine kinase